MSTAAGGWPQRPRPPHLPEGEVHVWSIRVDLFASCLRALERGLSAEELDRARRFRFPIHRDRFIARRGLMRILLGHYLGVSYAEVLLRETERGKPVLAEGQGGDDLRFNLSHSDGLALVAVARNREVGVDVERMRREVMDDHLPEHFFSALEVEDLRALPEEHQLRAFFNCWTRKEAYIKAKGLGLHLPLDSFDVSLAPGEPAVLIGTRPDPGEASRWSMEALSPDPGYAAALVVESPCAQLHCWEWSG